MKKHFRIAAALLAVLSVVSVSGCAISAALEEEGGFKYNSSQVSKEEDLSEVTLHEMAAASKFFGNVSMPAIFSDYKGTPYETVEGDLWVSPDGNDETGDGSKEKPYATFAKAQSAVREIKAAGKLPKGTFTVVFMPGEYRLTEGIKFTAEDSGTEDCQIIYAAYDSREVVFKGSKALNASDFTAVGDDIKAILPDESKDKVMMIDLKKYGITADQLHIYGIGQENGSMGSFDSSYIGTNVEFYFNREAFTLARWPNEGEMLTIDSVIDQGDQGSASPGIFKMQAAAAERVKTWHSLDDIWVVGEFFVNWATRSSLVTFDLDARQVTCVLNCFYTCHDGNPYHFYNVLDELDVPGEWYLDRENCILYMYPTGDMADAEIEFSVDFEDTMVDGDGLENVTFMGLTFMGGKNSGVLLYHSKNIHLDRCKLYGFSGGWACEIGGYDCSIIECEAHYCAYEGIGIFGGEKETLKPSNSLMENCYATHWGLVGQSFTVGLSIGGYGTTMRHCEAAYSQGNAVAIGEANNVIEYCLFHDCTAWSTDCGTLYTGSSLMGCINDQLRYNIFYNIGNEWAQTGAIFWDDGHGSQRAYGNLLVNIAGSGIIAGGGRNHSFMNNILVNTNPTENRAFWYDQRPYNGYMEHGRYEDGAFYDIGSGYMWGNFADVPFTQTWFDAIAYRQFIITDDSDLGSPYFMYAPAMSLFADNIVLNKFASLGRIESKTRMYSTFRDNYTGDLSANTLESIFVDPANGDYRIKEDAPIYEMIPRFKDIPYQLIGRY